MYIDENTPPESALFEYMWALLKEIEDYDVRIKFARRLLDLAKGNFSPTEFGVLLLEYHYQTYWKIRALQEQIRRLDKHNANPFRQANRQEVAEPPASTESLVNDPLKDSIRTLELTVRTVNCLEVGNIRTVGDLIAKTEIELMRTPNLGRKSIREIKGVLTRRGLAFQDGIKLEDLFVRKDRL